MKRKPYNRTVYHSLVLLTQFGINMLVPIGLMTALGIFLDGKFGTSWITILLFFAGAAAGGRNIYRMAKKVYDEPKQDMVKETDGGNAAEGKTEESE